MSIILARAPLRISLGGGGTDLPSYYEQHTGFLIAAAIDKYVYITLHETFVPELIVNDENGFMEPVGTPFQSAMAERNAKRTSAVMSSGRAS